MKYFHLELTKWHCAICMMANPTGECEISKKWRADTLARLRARAIEDLAQLEDRLRLIEGEISAMKTKGRRQGKK